MFYKTRFLLGLGGAMLLSACMTTGADVSRDAPAKTGKATVSSSSLSQTSSSTNSSREKPFKAYVTGYSYWSNTPPGSAAIARPVLRRRAGGTGTYKDPITIAVGHSINGSRQTLDYPAGTRFYIKGLRKYAIVEDVCGDGRRPQNGPCHTGFRGLPWLDIYVDGKGSTAASARACAGRLTRVHNIIQNPSPNYPVVVGALTESGCQVFPG